MRKIILFFNLIIVSSMFSQSPEPTAKKITKKLSKHNHDRIDDYYWMNMRDSKDVLDHLNKENAYCEKYFEPLNGLVDKLLKEFDQRINPNDVSAPFILNGKTYQVKNLEGKDYQQVKNLEGKDYQQIVQLEKGKETIFFDENERAKNQSFYELAGWSPSPDNKLLALTEDFVGRRKYVATFRNNSTGKFLKDKIQDVSGEIIWANDNKTVFYVKKDPQTLREFQVFRHILGTDSKNDALVYEEKDEKFSLGIEKTITDKYIVIQIASSTTSETWLIDANQANTNPFSFLKRKQGHLYDIGHHENGFYILSNSNASNKRLLFSKDVPKEIEACSEVTGKEQFVQFNEETYFLSPGLNDNYASDEIFYAYNSLTTPSTVYKYNMATEEKSIWFRKELLDKSFKSDDYESKRVWATANDGTKIPVCLVYKKGLDLSQAPCLLYGYGSYGYTLPDVFSATRLSLLNRGFVYAVAHIHLRTRRKCRRFVDGCCDQYGALSLERNCFPSSICGCGYDYVR